MNLLKFQIVELLDKHRKVTAVAEVLGLKQPTVTYHMKSLEQEYGVKLFEPRMDKVILTEAGRALLHYAGKINSLAAEARRTAQEYGTPGRGPSASEPAMFRRPICCRACSRSSPPAIPR